MKPDLQKLVEAVRDRLKGYHAKGARTKTFYIGPERANASNEAGPKKEKKNDTTN